MMTLAIETAIRGGSLSLLEDDREIDFWVGNNDVSKAEDVLEQIAGILKYNKVKKIDLIAVSIGPGSSTGIRIGLATALGLKMPFKCKIVGISIFEALIFNKEFSEPALLAIPFGNRQIAWQVFEKKTSRQTSRTAKIEFGNPTVFSNLLKNQIFAGIILHDELTKLLSSMDKMSGKSKIEIMDNRFATLIGLKARQTIIDKQNGWNENEFYASDNVKEFQHYRDLSGS